MIEQAIFAFVASCMLYSGLQVVHGRNLVHAVLWLGVTLSLTALLFLLLRAPFLAGIQILLYAGGVVTLMLFGIMLTHRHGGVHVENQQGRKLRGALAAGALFALMSGAICTTGALPHGGTAVVSAAEIGQAFLTDHLLAFEVLSLLLLAAMVGAIALARRSDYGEVVSGPAGRGVR
ncbi:MAG: NADH-quinone oxidoreductase subunit J [Nannocystaceae bacterium]